LKYIQLNPEPTLTSSTVFSKTPKPQTTSFSSQKRQDEITDNDLYGPGVNDVPLQTTQRGNYKREDKMTNNDLYSASSEDNGTNNYYDRSKMKQTYNQYPEENELDTIYSKPNKMRPPNRLEPSIHLNETQLFLNLFFSFNFS
jgi:hypothetical protein